ncbi:MAG: DUF420 domain-containing protein [Candidatus Methanofastidiosia archaeon]
MDGFFGTRASFYSDLSLSFEVLLVITFLIGYRYAKRHMGSKHHRVMLIVFLIDLSFFSTYMIKSLIEGRTEFTGPEMIYKLVYLPVVIIHSIVSVATLVLGVYMLFNGFRSSKDVNGRKVLVRNPKKHRRLGLITLIIFGVSAFSGFLVYILLYVLYA